MTYRLPSLNSLRAFEAAARHLSFRAAAVELGVTSGAISQQVKKLEQSLDVMLFQRHPHGLSLTARGHTYLGRMTQIFEDLTAATEEIAPDINGKKFSVGVSPDAEAFLPGRWPFGGHGLEPHVRDRIATSEIESVRNGTVDCLVLLGHADERHLASFRIERGESTKDPREALTLLCKTGMADCLQTSALVSNLRDLWARMV